MTKTRFFTTSFMSFILIYSLNYSTWAHAQLENFSPLYIDLRSDAQRDIHVWRFKLRFLF